MAARRDTLVLCCLCGQTSVRPSVDGRRLSVRPKQRVPWEGAAPRTRGGGVPTGQRQRSAWMRVVPAQCLFRLSTRTGGDCIDSAGCGWSVGRSPWRQSAFTVGKSCRHKPPPHASSQALPGGAVRGAPTPSVRYLATVRASERLQLLVDLAAFLLRENK